MEHHLPRNVNITAAAARAARAQARLWLRVLDLPPQGGLWLRDFVFGKARLPDMCGVPFFAVLVTATGRETCLGSSRAHEIIVEVKEPAERGRSHLV